MYKSKESERVVLIAKEKRRKLMELLGNKCSGCNKPPEETLVYVYAKGVYQPKWMPAKGLYGHSWEDIKARADDYYLSCNMCWTIKIGRAIEHGGGSQGKLGCKCEPCRLRRNEHHRNYSKQVRDQAKAWRELQKKDKI